jgi:hypothetical protein
MVESTLVRRNSGSLRPEPSRERRKEKKLPLTGSNIGHFVNETE